MYLLNTLLYVKCFLFLMLNTLFLNINFAYCLNHLLHLLIQSTFPSKQRCPHTVPDISHVITPGANAIHTYIYIYIKIIFSTISVSPLTTATLVMAAAPMKC